MPDQLASRDGGALLSAMRVSPNDGVEEVADGVGGTGLRQQLRTEARDLVRVPSGAGMRLDRVLQQAGKRGLEARNVIEGMGSSQHRFRFDESCRCGVSAAALPYERALGHGRHLVRERLLLVALGREDRREERALDAHGRGHTRSAPRAAAPMSFSVTSR